MQQRYWAVLRLMMVAFLPHWMRIGLSVTSCSARLNRSDVSVSRGAEARACHVHTHHTATGKEHQQRCGMGDGEDEGGQGRRRAAPHVKLTWW